MTGGYAGKLLYIDLDSQKKDERPLSMEVARNWLGSKGLAAKILYEELQPSIDPLRPENLLIFSTGPLTGMPISGAVKYNVETKSPLTGIWNDSSSSGYWGPQLKFAGYDALILKGRSKKPVYIWITDNTIEIRSAEHLWGMDCHQTDGQIKKELGDDRMSVAAIGAAGEKLVRYASISNDLWRHPARGGTGTVLGSKNVKAVAVRARSKLPVADMDSLKGLSKELNRTLRNQIDRWGAKHNIFKEGTNEFLDIEIETGITPWSNYRTITPVPLQAQLRKYTVRNRACRGCIQTCWPVRAVKEGPYAGTEGVGPEYESLACLGPVCGITDIPALIKGNLLCNLYGLDTISTGASVAFAMECYENGILSKEDVNGVDLRFGNAEAMLAMIEMIGERKGPGRILGEGVKRASKKIGRGSERFAIHTKGLEYPGYQPKTLPAMALAFATADRGACHLRAWITEEVQVRTLNAAVFEEEELKRRAQLVAETQNTMAWLNSIGMCWHVAYFFGYPKLPQFLHAVTGWKLSEKELNTIGERIYNLTRLFNVREGVTRKNDTLPWRFLEEPIPDGPNTGICINPEHLDTMLDHYYEKRGWNKKTGVPTQKKIEELGLFAL